MADLVDVENALVAKIAQTLYPTGTGNPSVIATPVIIYAGWPTASRLDADLLALSQGAGKIHVTVFPTKTERNTTRYMRQWQNVTLPAPSLTLTVSGQQVTVGGTVATPQNVMLMVGYKPYVYAVQPSDTLTSIATALAALISGASAGGALDTESGSALTTESGSILMTESAGPVITLPTNAILTAARVGASGTAIQEIRRQERVFQITIWADTPAHRDVATQAIDVALANIEFLVFTDTSAGRLIYKSTWVDDMVSKAILYRRDLLYSVEYATTLVNTTTQITQTQLDVNAASQPVVTVYS